MPALLHDFLEETFDGEYYFLSCRRLLNEAGLNHQKPRRKAVEADPEDRETLRDELKKVTGDGRHSSLHRSRSV